MASVKLYNKSGDPKAKSIQENLEKKLKNTLKKQEKAGKSREVPYPISFLLYYTIIYL